MTVIKEILNSFIFIIFMIAFSFVISAIFFISDILADLFDGKFDGHVGVYDYYDFTFSGEFIWMQIWIAVSIFLAILFLKFIGIQENEYT